MAKSLCLPSKNNQLKTKTKHNNNDKTLFSTARINGNVTYHGKLVGNK